MSVTFNQQALNLIEQLEKASTLSDPSKVRKLTSNFLVHVRRFQERSHWGLDQLFQSTTVAERIKQNPELTKSFTKPLEIFIGLHPSSKKQHPKRVALCKSLQSYLGSYNSKVVQKNSDKSLKEKGKNLNDIATSNSSLQKKALDNTSDHPSLLDPTNPFYVPPFIATQQITTPRPPTPPRPNSYTPRHCHGTDNTSTPIHSHHTPIHTHHAPEAPTNLSHDKGFNQQQIVVHEAPVVHNHPDTSYSHHDYSSSANCDSVHHG